MTKYKWDTDGWVEEEQHKTWGEMTPEEKGALLLAHHELKQLQHSHDGILWHDSTPMWMYCMYYRVKPEPKVETIKIFGCCREDGDWIFNRHCRLEDTHKITFDVVDCVPDCGSIKMEKL